MKKFNEKNLLNLIISKLGNNNVESYFGRDDISLVSIADLISDRGTTGRSIHNDRYHDNNSGTSFTSAKNHLFLAITCDMLVEHTDIPPTMNFKQIARKSVVSSISDLCAKGIRPVAALISLGLPRSASNSDMTDLIDGFSSISKDYNFNIIGGDINESDELVIDCCMLGFSTDASTVPRRNGSKVGDYVVVSGPFGYSSSGLKILLEKKDYKKKNNGSRKLRVADSLFKKKSIDSVLEPVPQYKFGMLLSRYFSSSIDSSDGLASSLYELAKESKVDMIIEKDKVPVPPELKKFLSMNNLDFEDLVFYGGEEYHIIGTISEKNLVKVNRLVKKYQLDIYFVGKVVEGLGKVFVTFSEGGRKKRKLLENKGFIHLS